MHTEEGAFLLKLNYTECGRKLMARSTIRDLSEFDEPSEEASCFAFLSQLRDVLSEWGTFFTLHTQNLLVDAADLQCILLRSADGKICDKNCTILTALRCLFIINDFSWVQSFMTHGNRYLLEWDFDHYKRLQPPYAFEGSSEPEPFLEVSKCPDADMPTTKVDEANNIRILLQKAFESAQSLLLRGRPKDWPAAFYTLLILQLVQTILSEAASFTDALVPAGIATRNAMLNLVQLFLYCAGDTHPLVDELDKEWYSLILGSVSEVRSISVQHVCVSSKCAG